MFGTAMQYDFLYADTIFENIRFGRDLTREQIEQAARIAQAHDFITSFKDGYEHMLSSKATNISGGQKQRLLIARAIAGNPDILILDDSSSALDYATDAALRQSLQKMENPPTTFIVSQRAASVRHADLILVLDDGKVVGLGTHRFLLENCSVYQEIYYSQFSKEAAHDA